MSASALRFRSSQSTNQPGWMRNKRALNATWLSTNAAAHLRYSKYRIERPQPTHAESSRYSNYEIPDAEMRSEITAPQVGGTANSNGPSKRVRAQVFDAVASALGQAKRHRPSHGGSVPMNAMAAMLSSRR